MRQLYRLSALLLTPIVFVSCATGPPVLNPDTVSISDTPRGKYINVPKGLKIETALEDELSSARSRVGQQFSVHTTEPVLLGSRVLIPEGTRINGTIKEIKPPKGKFLKAKVTLDFNSIDIGGTSYEMSGKTTFSKRALAEKGGKAGGEYAAKEGAKYLIPVLGWVFLAMDVKKGYDYYQSDKEITMPRGTPLLVQLKKTLSLPYR